MQEKRGLLARLGDLLRWLLLAVLVCAAGLVLFRQLIIAQLDEQIRLRVQAMFAAHYTDLDVQIQTARRIEGKGIELRGFSLRSNAEETAYSELLYIDEMFLQCQTDLGDLFRGKPHVQRLIIRRMKVRATCHQDREWNVARLLPIPDFGGHVPIIELEDSTIELQDLCRQTGGALALHDIDMRMQIDGDVQGSHRWHLSGSLLGDHFKRVKLEGLVDALRGRWSAWGTIDGLEMSQQLLDAMPNDVAQYLSVLATLRARAHFEFRLEHEPGDTQPIRCVVQGHLSEGRVDDPRLPLPLTDLEADVYCDNQQIRIENVTAVSGTAKLDLTCQCDNFLSDLPQLVLSAAVRQLPLDERLYEVLPARYRDDWDHFAPAGTVDAKIDLKIVDNRLIPDITVTCRDVSFAYHKFPLRLRQGTGSIRLVGNTVLVQDFTAVAGGQLIHLAAEFKDPGPRSTGWLDLRSDGPVPLDHELIEAISPAGRKIVRSLHPTGGIVLSRGRFERPSPADAPRTRWEIDLHDCSLQYDRFPYAIHNISGRLVLIDRQWMFQDLRGHHGSSYILCSGGWMPASDTEPGGELSLRFQCWDVPLNDSLRNAVGTLNAGAARFWDSVRPRGTVDHLNISTRYNSLSQQINIDLSAEKWPPGQNVEGLSITLYPTWFPLRLDDCTGRVRYTDGQFTLENVTARRGNSRVELTGHGKVTPDQRWEVSLSRLIADVVHVDHELVDALPAAMRQPVRQMKYRGAVSINGNAWLRGGGGQPLLAGWDLLLDIDDGALDSQLRLEHIYGGVRMTGEKHAQGFQNRGLLEIDSLMTRGVQLTQIQGPFWIDSRQLLFGSRASAVQSGRPPQQVTAKALGGDITLDAHLLLDDQLPFSADVSIADGDVAEISRSLHSQRHDISGKVFALLHLQGAKAGLHTLQGNGQVRLREADVYQLPVMVRLLKVLSLRSPDTTAFTSSDVDFRLQGEQIYLDRVDFSGDAISLKGKGWMDLNRQVNLDFYALVGRQEYQLPVIKTLLAEASKNILLIQVVGNVDDPHVIRKALPELDERLQRLFPEAVPHTASPVLPWQSGR